MELAARRRRQMKAQHKYTKAFCTALRDRHFRSHLAAHESHHSRRSGRRQHGTKSSQAGMMRSQQDKTCRRPRMPSGSIGQTRRLCSPAGTRKQTRTCAGRRMLPRAGSQRKTCEGPGKRIGGRIGGRIGRNRDKHQPLGSSRTSPGVVVQAGNKRTAGGITTGLAGMTGNKSRLRLSSIGQEARTTTGPIRSGSHRGTIHGLPGKAEEAQQSWRVSKSAH
mmetsp:Transcript_70657/g.132224  ORF Transcript_70657/g.132224 Transcript_70657/m.132224 type:complete len:221 (+) Transcript_70657:701-1363(+)